MDIRSPAFHVLQKLNVKNNVVRVNLILVGRLAVPHIKKRFSQSSIKETCVVKSRWCLRHWFLRAFSQLLFSITTETAGSVLKKDARIAIVGMAGRFPDAASHELFWDLLEKGLDIHRPVPADRYPVESHTDPTSKKKNTSHTPFGDFIGNPGLFDARFFNMSPREAAQTEPMQRLMLVTAYEAMEMGGIVPGRTPSTKHDRIGTSYGQTSDDCLEINAAKTLILTLLPGG